MTEREILRVKAATILNAWLVTGPVPFVMFAGSHANQDWIDVRIVLNGLNAVLRGYDKSV